MTKREEVIYKRVIILCQKSYKMINLLCLFLKHVIMTPSSYLGLAVAKSKGEYFHVRHE